MKKCMHCSILIVEGINKRVLLSEKINSDAKNPFENAQPAELIPKIRKKPFLLFTNAHP